MKKIKLAILGAGGLGRKACEWLGHKRELKLVGICDRQGYAFDEEGLELEAIQRLGPEASVAQIPHGERSPDPMTELIERNEEIEAIFIALPNLPNHFIPSVARRFIEGGYQGVFVDVLKRTQAMRLIFALQDEVKHARAVYLTGCGATPGLLSSAAVLAAQSFAKVDQVKIWWGVGIGHWEAYKATVREDIAHLPGFSVERAKAMTDVEVEELLEERDGKLEFHQMEHADDLLLQRVGVVEQLGQVEVGGVLDTRSAKKPVSTTMTLTGTTFEGKRSSHQFILGDETTMACNVLGPAFGYLKRGLWLKGHGIYGVFGSTEFMPMVVK